ncbi:MAG: hypothetical protein ACFFAT_16870 [Promethearchaeota archaeon]
MKQLYEIGIVFRGFVIINYIFKKLPKDSAVTIAGKHKDLRGAFVSAISSFAESAFTNTSLEYLESGTTLFIFKMASVKSMDSINIEPIILYGLVSKSKQKKVDKTVKKFLEKIEPLLQLFIQRYNGRDFCEVNQFQEFQVDIIKYFDIEKVEAAN